MTDIYGLQFDPNKLSHKQEQLGLTFSDFDTALELMKKEEKMIIADLISFFIPLYIFIISYCITNFINHTI